MRVGCHFKIRFQTWCITLRFSSRGKGTSAVDGLRHDGMHGLAEQGKHLLTKVGVKTHEIHYPEFFSQTNSWASGHHLLHFTQAVAEGFSSPGSHGTYAVPEQWDEFVGNLIGLLADIGVGGELAPVVLSGEAEAQTPAQVASHHFVSASCHHLNASSSFSLHLLCAPGMVGQFCIFSFNLSKPVLHMGKP